MEIDLFCINHPNKFAKRICKTCDSYLCNSCVLDFHLNHIQSIESINNIFNTKPVQIISKLIANSEEKLTNKINRCMYFVFHESTLYCKECQNFICEKCLKTHITSFHNHEIISIHDYLTKLKSKADTLFKILLFQKKDFIDKDQYFMELTNNINHKNSSFESFISRVFHLKKNIEETYKLLKNISFNLYQRIFEYFRKNQKRLLLDSKKIQLFEVLYNQIYFETDKQKILCFVIEFENIINDLISEDDFVLYQKLNSEESNLRLLISDIFNKISTLENEFIERILGDINDFNSKILTYSNSLKSYLKTNLRLRDIEIEDLFKHSKRETNYFNLNELNVKNKILLEEYNKRNEQIKDQRFNRVEKEIVFSENIGGSKKTSLKSLPSKPETYFQNSDIVLINQYPSKKFTIMKNIDEKEEVNLSRYSKSEYYNQTASISHTHKVIDEEIFRKENEESDDDNDDKLNVNLKNSEGLIKLFDINTSFNNTNNYVEDKDTTKEAKITYRQSRFFSENEDNQHHINIVKNDAIFTEKENHKASDDFFNSKQISAEFQELVSFTPVLTKKNKDMRLTEKDLLNLNRDMTGKFLRQSNIKIYQFNLTEKVNKFNEKYMKENINLDYPSLRRLLLESFTETEISNLETFAVGFNCKSLFCFNLAVNKIYEFNFGFFKFPSFHSSVYSAPFIYLTGGRESSNEIKSFFILRVNAESSHSFTFEVLPDMLKERSNHLMIMLYSNESKKILNSNSLSDEVKSLLVISGTNTSACEIYNFEESKWLSFPSLNNTREKASGIVYNNEYVYVFLGYDKRLNRFSGSIERISIHKPDKWEEIVPNTKLSLLKKYSIGLVYNTQVSPKEILIVGGVNAMRNLSKEVLVYNFEHNTLSLSKDVYLNEGSAFHSGVFDISSLNANIYYSFTEDFSFVIYDRGNKVFRHIKGNN